MSSNLYKLASNPDTDPDTLLHLAGHQDFYVRLKVANNAGSDETVLRALASDPIVDVRDAVIRHDCAPDDIILALVGCSTPVGQCALARRPGLSAAVVTALFTHGDEQVLKNLGGNTSTPESLLRQLSVHRDSSIRGAVASNPYCPPDVLLDLSRDHAALVVVKSAGNTSMPRQRLDDMARSSGSNSESIQLTVAANRSADASTLVWLLKALQHQLPRSPAILSNPSLPFISKLEVAFLCDDDSLRKMLFKQIKAKSAEFWRETGLSPHHLLQYAGREVALGDALISAGMIDVYQICLSTDLERAMSDNGVAVDSQRDLLPISVSRAKRRM